MARRIGVPREELLLVVISATPDQNSSDIERFAGDLPKHGLGGQAEERHHAVILALWVQVRVTRIPTELWRTEKEKYELRRAAWREQYKAASKKGNAEPACPEDEPEEPKWRRLIVNDATPEALHRTMSENPAASW